MNATIDGLLTAIASGDRWSIARRATGDLLRSLLLNPDMMDRYAQLHDANWLALTANPLTVVDDDVAIVIGDVSGPPKQETLPLCAVLVTYNASPHWLVAALEQTSLIDRSVRDAAVLRRFDEALDADTIMAAAPLDPRATAIDWDTPDALAGISASGQRITVADVLPELDNFARDAWPWLADEGSALIGLYLRARHPELLREPTNTRN